MESQFPVFEVPPEANPNPPKPIQNPVEFLYNLITIGSSITANNIVNLRLLGITNVLDCDTYHEDAEEYPGDISRLRLSFPKDVDANLNLMEQLPEAFAFIEETKQKGGKILVHCYLGRSRSFSIVMAYLIWVEHEKYNSLNDVYSKVLTIRCKANPHSNFLDQLTVFLEMRKKNPDIALNDLCDMVPKKLKLQKYIIFTSIIQNEFTV